MSDTPDATIKRRRRPLAAAVLALAGPGLGHLYTGSLGVAVGLAILALALLNVLFLLMIHMGTERLHLLVFAGAGGLLHIVAIAHAARTAGRQPTDFILRRYNRFFYYLIWWLAVAMLGLFTGSIFGDYRSFRTPSTSMESALFWGDYFIADMKAYETVGPARGDIAIFICPCDSTTLYLKRCVAVPGDTVQIIDKILYLNGARAAEPPTVQHIDTTQTGEPRIHPKLAGSVDSRDNYGPYVVPLDNFFMLGDNRDNSHDSRYWGFVPRDMMLGRVLRIYYSSDWKRIGLRTR